MMATINFYNQFCSRAIKINELFCDVFLPVELIIFQSFLALIFSIRHIEEPFYEIQTEFVKKLQKSGFKTS